MDKEKQKGFEDDDTLDYWDNQMIELSVKLI